MKTTVTFINFRKNCRAVCFALVIMCMAFNGPATTAGNDDPKNMEKLQTNPQAEITLQLTPYVYPNGYNVSCFGYQDGSINLTVSGGTPPYTYLWSTKEITEDITNLSATYYSVEVRDQYGNYNKADINLTQPEPGQIPEITGEVFEYSNGYNVSCFGCYNGSIDLIVTGGSGLYSYSWRDGPTTQDRFGLCGGTYEVIIRGISECNREQEFTRGFDLREPSRDDIWTMTGNSNSNPSTHFIGTSDNKDFVFKTNNTERLRILANGYIGIGTANPQQKLHVAGDGRFTTDLIVGGSFRVGSISDPNSILTVGGNGKVLGNFNVDGNIKIGNITATEKLAVAGSGKVTDDFTVGKKLNINGSLKIDSLAGVGFKLDSTANNFRLLFADKDGEIVAPDVFRDIFNDCDIIPVPWLTNGNIIDPGFPSKIGPCSENSFDIMTSGITRIGITNAGDINIGAYSPHQQFQVEAEKSIFLSTVGIGTSSPIDKLQISDGIESISFGSAMTPEAGFLMSYQGFNARHTRTGMSTSSDWNFTGSGSGNNGAAIIAVDVAGAIQFIPIHRTNTNDYTLSDLDIQKHKVVSIYGGTVDEVNDRLDGAYMLVNGKIQAKEVEVTLDGWWFWPDYVFEKKYDLLPLSEVEKYINEYKHLPGMPSAAEVERKGVALGENQALLLKKIEELTLYVIELNKQVEALKKENSLPKN